MFSMFGIYNNSKISPTEEKPTALKVTPDLTQKCSVLFTPKQIMQLYRDLNAFVADSNNAPTQNPVLTALGTTVQSYIGLPTNVVFAEKVRNKIAEIINPYDFKELLQTTDKGFETVRFSHSLSQEILRILRMIDQTVKEMPTEYITFDNAYFKKGSKVRKRLEETLEYYRVELKNNGFSTDFDNADLCNIMKHSVLPRSGA